MECIYNVTGGEATRNELKAYYDRAVEQYHKAPTAIDVKLDGEFVDLAYHFQPVSFQRIRRITGYLVGTLDRFNNAKAAEERDRVKHGVTEA